MSTHHGSTSARSYAVSTTWARRFRIFIWASITLFMGCLLIVSRASALDINWSFFDVDSGETIGGTVVGLVDNATGGASDVIITSDGPTLGFSLPQSTIAGAFLNEWTVAAGVITSFSYLSLEFAPSISGEYLLLGTIPDAAGAIGAFTAGSDLSSYVTRIGALNFSATSETTSSVPEPTSLILFGLGLVGISAAMGRKDR